jgi:glutamate carboxypeptidase
MARKNHIGLVFEPGFGDGAFVSKRKGSANLTLIARGKSAHAGRDFHAGRNSIFALARLITEIEHLNLNEQGTTLNVGHIEGGGPVNIVPDLAICRLNIRSSTAQNLLDTLEQIRQLVQQASSKGIEIELIEDYCRLPKPFDVAHQALFEQYATCANDLHYPFLLRESGGVCDGNTLAEAGLPTLDSLGAIGGLMHTDEEYLLIPSLVQRAQIATLFLLKLASGAISLPK